MSITRTGVYVDDFLNDSSSLPQELSRFLSTMRELDERSQSMDLQNQIREQAKLLSRFESGDEVEDGQAAEEVGNLKKEMIANHEKNLGLCTEKVLLAKQAYDLVDSHWKKLNNDIVQFEQELKQDGKFPKQEQGSVGERKKVSYFIKRSEPKSDRDKQVRKEDEYLSEVENDSNFSASPPQRRRASSAHSADQSVENEPTYCVCGQVSYGNMIACDSGEACKGGEWFHYGCVGLGSEANLSKGQEWYCPACREERGI